MTLDPSVIREHGISPAEYETILDILGREPNWTELGIFSVMWSEHCSYKSSRILLKLFPTSGPRVLQGPGENAGAVSIGDGLATIFKMESHNHPSFIEPYQGAGTGVGGILRDIFTMGARPIASMNSLHFGFLDIPKNRYLLNGVVAGIAGYGNCMGIPTVGGEVVFHEHYNGNPIINVFSLGMVREDSIFLGKAAGIGNPVIYVGSKTGRDGIHGATMASEEFDETSEERRPTVQVGDPFTEKCLLEACIELMKTDAIVAIQDMGAAGLTCSTVEMSSRGGVGMEIDLDLVPQRESMMSCYEMMLSESQERMLIVAKPGHEHVVTDIFHRWGLEAATIGTVIAEDLLVVKQGGETVARIPASALTDRAPIYKRPRKVPARMKNRSDKPPVLSRPRKRLTDRFISFIGHPTLASKSWIFEQYDHMVRTNTVLRPGADAAVVRIKGTRKALAMTVDSNPRLVFHDPFQGSIATVCESARNLAAVGAEPLALTDCLNFGSPENPEVMWEFARSVHGISRACSFLNIPVISGNVSFYNETLGTPIFPTPTIGMVGLIEDIDSIMPSFFQQEGDSIYLIGPQEAHLGASLYLAIMEKREEGPTPRPNLALEKKHCDLVRELIRMKLIASAHDISDGGLAVALAECCFNPHGIIGMKAVVTQIGDIPRENILFGEGSARFVVSCRPDRCVPLEAVLRKKRIRHTMLGQVGGGEFRIASSSGIPIISAGIEEIHREWRDGLTRIMSA